MKRITSAIAAMSIGVAALSGAAIAQGVAQNTPPRPMTTQAPASPGVAVQPYAWRSVDVRTLADGYRSSTFVGSNVVNEANETIGTIDDLIIMSGERSPYAVISVGGFLGMGSKYVVVPYSALQVRDKQILLRGATKDSLKALDEYKYPI